MLNIVTFNSKVMRFIHHFHFAPVDVKDKYFYLFYFNKLREFQNIILNIK